MSEDAETLTGAERIEDLVEGERRHCEAKAEKIARRLRSYGNSLFAEAALPDRRPEWVRWANERGQWFIEQADRIDERLKEVVP